jgi:hypothetical protein
MVLRKAIGASRFDPALGYRGNTLMAREDFDFCEQILTHGWIGQWIPHAEVRHYVDPDRVSIAYMTRRIMGEGRTQVLAGGAVPGRSFLGFPLWLCRQSAQYAAQMVYQRIRRNRIESLLCLRQLLFRAGMLLEFRKKHLQELRKGIV